MAKFGDLFGWLPWVRKPTNVRNVTLFRDDDGQFRCARCRRLEAAVAGCTGADLCVVRAEAKRTDV